jgi:beta-lactamase class D
MRNVVRGIILLLFVSSCGLSKFEVEKAASLDLKKEESSLYSFSVVIYDLKTRAYFYYNDSMLNVPYSPASTFKIPNTLIGLETKILKDSTTIFNLGGLDDPSLKRAFQNSIVPYYQELAKQIGEKEMKSFLKRFQYGNALITPELTNFWLKGDLRITALEQIEFLYKIEKQQLGLRPQTYHTLKEIFQERREGNLKIYGKTGWGFQDGQDIGWFVGFAKHYSGQYLFATIMTSPEEAYGKFDFATKRISLTNAAFQQLINR